VTRSRAHDSTLNNWSLIYGGENEKKSRAAVIRQILDAAIRAPSGGNR